MKYFSSFSDEAFFFFLQRTSRWLSSRASMRVRSSTRAGTRPSRSTSAPRRVSVPSCLVFRVVHDTCVFLHTAGTDLRHVSTGLVCCLDHRQEEALCHDGRRVFVQGRHFPSRGIFPLQQRPTKTARTSYQKEVATKAHGYDNTSTWPPLFL